MHYKDIVNRDIYNLKNCDEEPIHIPGSIQPHGFLIAIDKNTNTVQYCSENLEDYLGIGYEQALGKSLEEIFEPAFVADIHACTGQDVLKRNILERKMGDKDFLFTVHTSNSNIIIEGEVEGYNEVNGLYSSSRQLLGYMEDSYTLKQLCGAVANAIKDITGYDRVMIYRFDKEYNGEVIAEAREAHLEAFLGLHYPHTDIPVQARELYIKNQLRIIGDVNYVPVPVYTSIAGDNSSLDLSLSVLRSVSPMHLQYLNNMGVGATLTISLLHKGRLWGLIACHHYSTKYISSSVRQAAKLHGHFITSQIDVRLLNEEYELMQKTSTAFEESTGTRLSLSFESLQQAVMQESALHLCNAAGISAMVNGSIYKHGRTPQDEEIRNLADYLAEYTACGELNTDSLASISSDLNYVAKTYPGISYMCFDFHNTDCIIWYREETVKEVNWAGDPAKAIEKDQNGLSPRKSFLLWKETVKGKSNPWLEFELNTARRFFSFLQNHLRSVILYREHEKQKEITKMLEETNAELENINWISTHDLQEPLRKIRMMSSIILSEEQQQAPGHFYELVNKMNASAERMQTLIHDILSYTKIKAEDAFEQVDLEQLVRQVTADLNEAVEEKNANIIIGSLPVIKGIPFLLRQLFSNLINNSLKFHEPSRKPEINILLHGSLNREITIQYTDNGIGFDPAYNEKVFDVFSRLYTKDKYTGSGIGLALCKKIMAKHNGFITAEGIDGKGVVFTIRFPAS